MSISYYEEKNQEKIVRAREILQGLPPFCRDFYVGIEMNTAPSTRLAYLSDLEVFFDYIEKNTDYAKNLPISKWTLQMVDKITASDIEYFLSHLSYYEFRGVTHQNNERAKMRKLSSIRAFFKYFYTHDKLNENVATKITPPKLHEKEIIRLNSEEVTEILTHVEEEKKFSSSHQNNYNLNTRDRDMAILYLLLGTGIRVSECVGLNVNDFNFSDNSFIVTRKGGNRSILYYSDEVKETLENYCTVRGQKLFELGIDEDAMFLSLQNHRMCVRAVEQLVKKYAKITTPLKQISPHKLRSTYGTELYRATKDIYVVAEVLGHKDVNTTKKHYAALSEDVKRAASTRVTLKSDIDDAK